MASSLGIVARLGRIKGKTPQPGAAGSIKAPILKELHEQDEDRCRTDDPEEPPDSSVY
jgi:hypothetical protein